MDESQLNVEQSSWKRKKENPLLPEHEGKAVRSLAQSDDECLSPQEEAMEVGEVPALTKRVHFKEPPSFQVTSVMSVCVI